MLYEYKNSDTGIDVHLGLFWGDPFMSRKPYLWAGVAPVISGALLLAPGHAAAQQQRSAAQQALLEEVVVTARRREEGLDTLPLSIAAISAEQMEVQGIYSIEDVSDFVPNVTLSQSDRANNTRVVIRGIGGGHPDPVFVFGAGMYIDGHYIPNSLGGYMSTMDIERVELLRGPQGTLFGKNVTGGAVNIISAKPGPEFESSLTLRAGDDGDQDVRGMINFPISDNVFARVSVASEQFDGYYFNRNLNINTGGEDIQAINAALRFTPGNWIIDANVNHIKRRDDNKGGQCATLDGQASQWGGNSPVVGGHLNRFYYDGFKQDFFDACDADAAAGTFVNSSDKITFSHLDVDSVFASAQWDSDGPVGGLDSLTFKVNASYRGTDYDYLQDRDYSLYDIDNIGMPIWATSSGGDIGQDNWTRGSEVLVEAQVNDRLEFTVGVNSFYELAKNGDGRCRARFEESGFADVVPGSNPPAPVNPGPGVNCDDALSGLMFDLAPGSFIPFINSSRVENESIGVFGHLTYALNDNWDLDFGARWTEDDRNFWNMESAVQNCTTDDHTLRTLGSQPNAEPGLCTFNYTVTFDDTIGGGFYNEAAETFTEVTPMISLTRNLPGGGRLDSGMVYFLYSEGFLTGGFNTEINSNFPDIASLLSYSPENVTNFEVGFKGTLAGGNVRIMADVFFMDYQDKQEDITIDNSDGRFGQDVNLGVRTNVAQVDIAGIELELRASPWDGGFVSVDLGYLDNEYGEFVYPDPDDPANVIDETNTSIADLTAKWTINVGIEHEFALANGATLTPRLNVYAQDDYDYQSSTLDAPPSICNQPSYTKVGARLTYTPPAGNWRAALFGYNITDEKILEMCGDTRGLYTYRHERPAWWGAEFTMRWGNN